MFSKTWRIGVISDKSSKYTSFGVYDNLKSCTCSSRMLTDFFAMMEI